MKRSLFRVGITLFLVLLIAIYYRNAKKIKEFKIVSTEVGFYSAIVAGIAAYNTRNAAWDIAKILRLQKTHHNAADAIKHATWSIELTRKLGKERAEKIKTIHEENNSNNKLDEKTRDSYNNWVGREIALCYKNCTPKEVAIKLLIKGQLKFKDGESLSLQEQRFLKQEIECSDLR